MASPLGEQMQGHDQQASEEHESRADAHEGDVAAPASGEQQGSNTKLSAEAANDSALPPLRHQPSNETGASQYPNRTAVELDTFDPAGVEDLRRTLTKASQGRPNDSRSFSDITLDCLEIGDGPFDLEKFLRSLVKQYVYSVHGTNYHGADF